MHWKRMDRAQIQELRRVLNQSNAVLDAGIILAAADQALNDRLKEIRGRLRDERLSELTRLPQAARAY
jgi:hypothetical protein